MSITALSQETIIQIYQDPNLSPKDICRGHQVCTEWNELLGDKWVWNPRRFNEAGLPTVEGIDTKLKVESSAIYSPDHSTMNFLRNATEKCETSDSCPKRHTTSS